MNLNVISSLSSVATEMDRWLDKQVAVMLQLHHALASAESLFALQSAMVCVCVCEIGRTLALLLGFDLSGAGATTA